MLREINVREFPREAPVHEALARQLALDEPRRDPARALFHAEKALSLAKPPAALERETLAAALAVNGRFEEARRLVEALADEARAAGSARAEVRLRLQAQAFAAQRPWSRADELRARGEEPPAPAPPPGL